MKTGNPCQLTRNPGTRGENMWRAWSGVVSASAGFAAVFMRILAGLFSVSVGFVSLFIVCCVPPFRRSPSPFFLFFIPTLFSGVSPLFSPFPSTALVGKVKK